MPNVYGAQNSPVGHFIRSDLAGYLADPNTIIPVAAGESLGPHDWEGLGLVIAANDRSAQTPNHQHPEHVREADATEEGTDAHRAEYAPALNQAAAVDLPSGL